MGERAKIILNEHFAKSLLLKDTLDLNKFYTSDLKTFIDVARKEIKKNNNIMNNLEKKIEEMCEKGNISYKEKEELIKIIRGGTDIE